MKKETRIKLPQHALDFAIRVGNARYAKSREQGVVDGKVASDAFFIDQNGAAGEVAFLILLLNYGLMDEAVFLGNLTEIARIDVRSAVAGTDTGDIVLQKGGTIDVKTTEYQSGSLIVLPHKLSNKVDGYVLMKGSVKYGVFVFGGWKDREGVRNVPVSDPRGIGKYSHWLSAEKLNDIDKGQDSGMHPLVMREDIWQM